MNPPSVMPLPRKSSSFLSRVVHVERWLFSRLHSALHNREPYCITYTVKVYIVILSMFHSISRERDKGHCLCWHWWGGRGTRYDTSGLCGEYICPHRFKVISKVPRSSDHPNGLPIVFEDYRMFGKL